MNSTISSTNTYHKESNSTVECLELRTCISCYQPINLEEYVMWELTEFCNVNCTSNYLKSLRSSCSTCFGTIHGNDYLKYYMRLDNSFILFCSHICLEKYSKSVKICSFCEKPKSNSNSLFWVSAQLYLNETQRDMSFCSDQCFKDFVRVSKMCPPVIPPGTKCKVCNIDDPVTIATKHDGTPQYFCGSRCQIAFNFVRIQMGSLECKMCGDYFTPLPSYTIRIFEGNTKFYFCSQPCKNVYMLIKAEDVICSWCQSIKSKFGMIGKYVKCNLEKIFCSINCFVDYQDTSTTKIKSCSTLLQALPSINGNEYNMVGKINKQNDVVLKKTICIWASHECEQRNVATMCSVSKQNKNVATDLAYSNKSTQTDLCVAKTLLPVPVPIYVPTPMQMFSVPVPVVVPIPIPIPIPVFLPCSQNSINKIINRVQEIKIIPNNICEAEMLQIAEIIAEEEGNNKLSNETVSDGVILNAPYFCESNIEEICENIDVENALSVNACDITNYLENEEQPPMKFFKCESQHFKEKEFNTAESFNDTSYEAEIKNTVAFKTDMRLDYTLGINAWKQWASKTLHFHKNLKFIKSEILEMTPDELGFALCLFVKELRKPNGDEYAPDTIYYLCLGIQYYLDLNGRTDRIFFERIYEKFIECFDEFAKKFCTLYDDESHFIVTRVEEEHLWETKQLGCWSPYALLNTLVYFNTKYYCRANVEEHMELSFFHIMKAHKKSKADNYFILRLYPRSKSDDKQVYEQYQNKEDPLRCPVKLYEFYLSKCPESVKNSSNMLYLMPEKYVISESPLWYSATPLSKDFLATLLNRVKMIKEINVALLTP